MTRILMESYSNLENVFCTLTYSDEKVPLVVDGDMTWHGNLSKVDVQLFLKRLRKAAGDRRVRHFVVGEYGERTRRPHYHAVLFGLSVFDEELICKTWQNGSVQVSELNRARARYAARYIMKKLTSPSDFSDGRAPEFAIMSKRPGLGVGVLEGIAISVLRGGLSMCTSHLGVDGTKMTLSTLPGCVRLGGKLHRLDPFLKSKLNMKLQGSAPSSLTRSVCREVKDMQMDVLKESVELHEDMNRASNVDRRGGQGRVI